MDQGNESRLQVVALSQRGHRLMSLSSVSPGNQRQGFMAGEVRRHGLVDADVLRPEKQLVLVEDIERDVFHDVGAQGTVVRIVSPYLQGKGRLFALREVVLDTTRRYKCHKQQ